ncbi:hypothetical protein ACCO45_006534 [Purpureocillium lilacinum]|uniref:Uncharacterized protein n=1 Tax=Purpureocillium lilacinum TaxID=33203 RepID=A0ACC4DPR8_PURLI
MPFRLPALGAKRLYAARSSWWPRRDTLSRTTRRDDNTRDNPGGVTTMCLSEPRLTQAAGRWKWRHVARKQRKHDGRSTGCIAQSPTGDDFGRTSQKGRPTGPRLRSGRLPDERLALLFNTQTLTYRHGQSQQGPATSAGQGAVRQPLVWNGLGLGRHGRHRRLVAAASLGPRPLLIIPAVLLFFAGVTLVAIESSNVSRMHALFSQLHHKLDALDKHVQAPVPVSVPAAPKTAAVPTGDELGHCGSSIAEARSLGCIFDPMSWSVAAARVLPSGARRRLPRAHGLALLSDQASVAVRGGATRGMGPGRLSVALRAGLVAYLSLHLFVAQVPRSLQRQEAHGQ